MRASRSLPERALRIRPTTTSVSPHAEGRIDYDPLAADYARHRRVHPEALRGLLEQSNVEFTHVLTDIQMYRHKAFSVLHEIGRRAFRRGMERMEQALRGGPIVCVPRYLML